MYVIEDYKNIKKQGFNFSPQFHCEYNDEYDENGFLEVLMVKEIRVLVAF